MSEKRLFLVDAMALAFRSFFAFGRTPLRTADGRPTAAIFGTAMFLNKLITEERPELMAVVADSDTKTFRHDMYAEYKGTRDRMPSDLGIQMKGIFTLFEKMHLPVLKVDGFEADDVIGTIARRFASKDLKIFIVSGDKDFMQLVNDHVRMYTPKRDEPPVIVDRDAVREKFHCSPEQVIDCLALMGDSSDNVPGVPGIGEKGAAKLIETYGDLDGIYAKVEEIKAKKQRENLIAHKDDAYLSKELVTIHTDAPIDIQVEQMAIDPDDAVTNDDLLALYDDLEFRQLATKAREARGDSMASARTEEAISATVSGPPDVSPEQKPDSLEYAEGGDPDRVVRACREAGTFAVHVEFTGSGPADFLATHVSFSPAAGRATRLDLADPKVREAVTGLLGDPKLTKTGHGLKDAWEALAGAGIPLKGPLLDAKVMDYLLDPNNNNHTFDACLVRHLGTTRTLDSEIAEVAEKAGGVPEEAFRNCERADLAGRLVRRLLPFIEASGMEHVLRDIEMPLIPVLGTMERTGVHVECDFLLEYSSELDEKVRDVEKRLYGAAGREFNVNSPKQLQELLYKELKVHEAVGVKKLKRTKTGFSTDESVLTTLSEHPVPRLILELRSITKLKNTYVDPLPQHCHPKTSRLHTRFRQTVAATGRLASDSPNLQNIPMRTEMGRKIRQAFTPSDKDFVIVSADYSQVEIRLLAHLANAEELIEAFRKGLDIHRVTAAKIFAIGEDEVDPVMRSRAKAVNFGIIYGMGPQRLAQDTGVSLTEAKDFIGRYFEVYPGIRDFTVGLINKARTLGYSETITGRRRPIPALHDRNRGLQARAENIAVNAPIQGSAADLIKLAMIAIHQDLKASEYGARMLLQIHDELVFECPEKHVDPVKTIIRERMMGAIETRVPLEVEIGVGKTWLEAH